MKTLLSKLALIIVLLAISLGINCATIQNPHNSAAPPKKDENQQPPFDETKVLKIKISMNGKIYLNEKESTLSQTKRSLAELKTQNGVVWYYRENPEGDPPKEGLEIINAIIEAGLPVKLSSRPDFSDTVDEMGYSKPTT